MKSITATLYFCCLLGLGLTATTTVKDAMDLEWNKFKALLPTSMDPLKLNSMNQTACTCGVFFSGQFKKDSPPVGYPVLMHEHETMHNCNAIGTKQCSNKCLETVRFI